jgi:hypothetical protein
MTTQEAFTPTVEGESGLYVVDCEWLAYPVTGKTRGDGKVLFHLYGLDRTVWRSWADVERADSFRGHRR